MRIIAALYKVIAKPISDNTYYEAYRKGNQWFIDRMRGKDLEITDKLSSNIKTILNETYDENEYVEWEVKLEADYYPGRKARGPSMKDPGDPPEPEEIEIYEALLQITGHKGNKLGQIDLLGLNKDLEEELEEKMIDNLDTDEFRRR